MRGEMGLAVQRSRSGDRHEEGNEFLTRSAGPDFLCIGAHKAGTHLALSATRLRIPISGCLL